jgi:NADP-dependent 3-hydroxy acid dehydrogenase YdfG
MSVKGARILVVGGSAGLGRETGLQAARAGASVAFAARRKDRLDQAVAEAGGGVAVQLDVTDPASVEAGVADALAQLGGIDVLLYASGWADMAPLHTETADHWQRMFATNVIGASSVVQALLPALPSDAVLAFLTSSSTDRRLWGMHGYAATKAALDRYLVGLKDEQPKLRITQLQIGPTIGTEFGNDFAGDVLTEGLARWVTSGSHMAGLMTVPDAGGVILGVLALLRAHPAVDLPRVQVDPAGGTLTLPPTQEAVAQAYASLAD